MKIKQLSAALMALGLAGGSALATAGDLSNPEGPAPDLTRSEMGALILAETILSITAAFASNQNGCDGVEGTYGFEVWVQVDGNGFATYPTGQNDPIELLVSFVSERIFSGKIFDVDSKDPGDREYLGKESIRNYDGTLAYSHGGAILISQSYFDMYEFNFPFEWDEHNIKDFWVEEGDKDKYHIEDAGLEVITKEDYPLTKWRQESEHDRWNNPENDGELYVKKVRITPWNLLDCTIEMEADVGNVGGPTHIVGTVKVDAEDF